MTAQHTRPISRSIGEHVDYGTASIQLLEPRRLWAAGDLDDTFGPAGLQITDIPGGSEQVEAITVLGDGKIVAWAAITADGQDESTVAVLRFNADGTPDTTFGRSAAGRTDVDLTLRAASTDLAERVWGLPNGGALVASVDGLARLRGDGSLDPTFGHDGIADDALAPENLWSDVAVRGDGKIYVSRVSDLLLLEPDGSRDEMFGTDGVRTIPAHAIDLSADDALYAAGFIVNDSNPDDEIVGLIAQVRRLAPDGTQDPNYGNEGVAEQPFGAEVSATISVDAADDGTVVVGSRDDVSTTFMRFAPAGVSDASFDGDGRKRILGPLFRRFAQDINGGIVFAGDGFHISRVAKSGSIDFTNELDPSGPARALATGPDGSIVVGGDDAGALALARLWPDDGPLAQLTPRLVRGSLDRPLYFTVTWRDDEAVDVSSLDDLDLRILLPNDGGTRKARLHSVDSNTDGQVRAARYKLTAPDGTWDANDNGAYAVRIRRREVSDTSGRWARARDVGVLRVDVPGGSNAEDVRIAAPIQAGMILASPRQARPLLELFTPDEILDRLDAE